MSEKSCDLQTCGDGFRGSAARYQLPEVLLDGHLPTDPLERSEFLSKKRKELTAAVGLYERHPKQLRIPPTFVREVTNGDVLFVQSILLELREIGGREAFYTNYFDAFCSRFRLMASQVESLLDLADFGRTTHVPVETACSVPVRPAPSPAGVMSEPLTPRVPKLPKVPRGTKLPVATSAPVVSVATRTSVSPPEITADPTTWPERVPNGSVSHKCKPVVEEYPDLDEIDREIIRKAYDANYRISKKHWRTIRHAICVTRRLTVPQIAGVICHYPRRK